MVGVGESKYLVTKVLVGVGITHIDLAADGEHPDGNRTGGRRESDHRRGNQHAGGKPLQRARENHSVWCGAASAAVGL